MPNPEILKEILYFKSDAPRYYAEFITGTIYGGTYAPANKFVHP